MEIYQTAVAQGLGRFGSSEAFYPADAVQPMPSALLENTIVRLERVSSRLSEANKIASETRIRTFGPWPEAGQAGNIREASAPSQQGRIGEMIDRLERQALEVLEHANTLSNSL